VLRKVSARLDEVARWWGMLAIIKSAKHNELTSSLLLMSGSRNAFLLASVPWCQASSIYSRHPVAHYDIFAGGAATSQALGLSLTGGLKPLVTRIGDTQPSTDVSPIHGMGMDWKILPRHITSIHWVNQISYGAFFAPPRMICSPPREQRCSQSRGVAAPWSAQVWPTPVLWRA